jgi:hypothetical protein
MLLRSLSICLLAIALLGRTFHCICAGELPCAGAAEQSDAARPLCDPTQSDTNESGCICKGALFGWPVVLANLLSRAGAMSPLDQILPPVCLCLQMGLDLTRADRSAIDQPPPAFGRDLRALLGSLLI